MKRRWKSFIVFMMIVSMAFLPFLRIAYGENSTENLTKPTNPAAVTEPQKDRREVLEEVYDGLNQMDAQEIEKSLGLNRKVAGGNPKYYLNDKLIEDLTLEDLKSLNNKINKSIEIENSNDRALEEENRKELQDMMDMRRQVIEEQNRNRQR